jgi:hypothetical protein
MPAHGFRYEICVDLVPSMDGEPGPSSNWSWRKLDEHGAIVVHGTNHRSLQACFAAARAHRSAHDDAPIRINLRELSETEPYSAKLT